MPLLLKADFIGREARPFWASQFDVFARILDVNRPTISSGRL